MSCSGSINCNLKTEICADQKLVHLNDDDLTVHWLIDSSGHSKDDRLSVRSWMGRLHLTKESLITPNIVSLSADYKWQSKIIFGYFWWGGRGVLPYLVGRSRGDDPRLGIFNPTSSLFYTSTQSNWPPPPHSVEKIGLSLSHLLPEILGPKVGLIFYQNVLFNRFKVFCINFPLIFDPIDPLFHWF